jgi:hypothetical protein
MNWEDQKKLSDAAFKELSGVKRETFEQMLAILDTLQGHAGSPGILPAHHAGRR